MALLAAVVGFCHLLSGFDNRALTALMGALLDRDYTGRHATYDLRRLRRKRLIERLPHSHRYQLTPNRRRIAVLFTKAHGRILGPGLAVLDPALPTELAKRSPWPSSGEASTANPTASPPTGWPPPETAT